MRVLLNRLNGWQRIFFILAIVWFVVMAIVCVKEGPDFNRYEMREYQAAFHNLLGFPGDEAVAGELLLFLMQNPSVDDRIREMSRRADVLLGSVEAQSTDTWYRPMPEKIRERQASWANTWAYSARRLAEERDNIPILWAKHVGLFVGLMWAVPLALLYFLGLLVDWVRRGFRRS